MSKRKLLELVRGGHVSGWDDSRMPTLCGMRRRGYTPEAIKAFLERIGMAKRDSTVDIALLENFVREDLNHTFPARDGCLAAVARRHHELRGGAIRRGRSREQPGGSGRRDAEGPLLTRALRRSGRLPRDAAAEVLPALAGTRGAAARGVLHHLHRGREGSEERRGHGGALHLRSRDARRVITRRPEGPGDDPLGLGGPRGRRPRRASTTISSRRRTRRMGATSWPI